MAPVHWAQRPKWIFLTVPVVDIDPQSVDVRLDGEKVSIGFSQKSGASFAEELMLFGAVQPFGTNDGSRFAVSDRALQVRLARAKPGPYWDRLTSEKIKKPSLKVDWNRWKDEEEVKAEEEEAEAAEFAKGAFNASKMGDDMTVSGAGDPEKIAELQRTYLAEKARQMAAQSRVEETE